MLYLWLVFLHVLSGFGYFFSHGASAFILLKLSQERNVDRIHALLDLRAYAAPAMNWSGGLLFLSGIVAGFIGHWWRSGWIWVSLGLLVLVSILMTVFGRTYFERVRKAIGLEFTLKGSKPSPPEKPVDEKELAAVIASGKPVLLASSGLVALALIVWLMMFKPF